MPIGAEIATEKARSAILFSRETRLQGEVLCYFFFVSHFSLLIPLPVFSCLLWVRMVQACFY